MMLGSQCSPCCGPSCQSFESRLPFEITAQITDISVGLFGNSAECQSELLAAEPFSFWYSRPTSAVGPFFGSIVSRDMSGVRACMNCRWRADFVVNAGDFFAEDFIRVDIDCSVIGGQLVLISFVEARLRGTRFFTLTGLSPPTVLGSLSPAALESATTLSGVMFTQATECRGTARIQIGWPGLNPLP